MKVVEHTHRSSHRPPTVRRPRLPHPDLPSVRQLENVLRIALGLILFGAAVWYGLRLAANDAAPALNTDPVVRLELILSGALSGSLSLGAAELKTVRCDASGFQLASIQRVVYPLELAFRGTPNRAKTYAYYALGSGGDFKLKVSGTRYTLLSGTVTASPGVRTFNASFIDVQSQPLQLSGRLVCP